MESQSQSLPQPNKVTFLYLGCYVDHELPCNTSRILNSTSTFKLILRDGQGGVYVHPMEMVYRVAFSCDTKESWDRVWLHLLGTLSSHRSSMEVEERGEKKLMYRRKGYCVLVKTVNYHTYMQLKRLARECHVIAAKCGVPSLCEYNTAVEPEDQMKYHLGIHSCNYVNLYWLNGEVVSIVPASKDDIEAFPYKYRVAGYDNEMLTVDYMDPSGGPYMTSYFIDNTAYVFYTADFYDKPIDGYEATEATPYAIIPVLCRDQVDLACKWAQYVYATRPDVVTGYYIYHADVPTTWSAVARQGLQLPIDPLTRIVPYIERTRKLDKHSQDSERGMIFNMPGITFVDMYSYLVKNISNEEQTDMKLDTLARRYLNDSKTGPDYVKLRHNYYSKDVADKEESIVYAAHDAYLPAMLYRKFNVWERQRAMYEFTNVEPQRHLTNGMVMQVYGALLNVASKHNYVIDSSTAARGSPGGGNVLDPIKAWHRNLATLDVGAMYPSLTMMLYACPSNMYRRVEDLPPGPYDMAHTKSGIEYYFSKTEVPLFARLMFICKDERDRLKKELAALAPKGKDSLEYKLASAAELAVKEIANSAVGATAETSSGSNPITCPDLNDIITTAGRAHSEYIIALAEEYGLTVVYGDTDSVMVKPADKVDEFLEYLHSKLRPEIRLKKEYVATVMGIVKKKNYVCLIDGKLKIAGYKATKSSSPVVCRDVFQKCVEVLIYEGADKMWEKYQELSDYHTEHSEMADFCWKFKHSGKVYADGTAKKKQMDALAYRNIHMVAAEVRLVTFVYCNEDYVRKYNEYPPRNYRLPYAQAIGKTGGAHKTDSAVIFTIEELIDRRMVNTYTVIDYYCRKSLAELAALPVVE